MHSIPPVVWMVALFVGTPVVFAICLMMSNRRPGQSVERRRKSLNVVQGTTPK